MAHKAAFAAFDEAVRKDQIYECERLANEVEALAAKNAAARTELEARAEVVAKVRKDVKFLTGLLDEIKTDDGWKFATKKKGLTVHFKQPEGSPFIMTKATSRVMPIPGKPLTYTFIALCSLFAEIELMPKYFPRGLMESHETLLEESAFSRFTRIRIKLPPLVPISPREAIINGRGYDMSERSAMAIAFNTLDQDYKHPQFKVPEPNKKYTRIEISGAYYLEIQDDGSVIFSQLQLMDLKLKYVPSFILNMLSKGQLPVDFNTNLMKRVYNWEGSEWETLVRAKPALYEDVRKRLEDYLTSRGKDATQTVAEAPVADAQADQTDGGNASDDHEPSGFESFLRGILSPILGEDHANEMAGKAGALLHKFSGVDHTEAANPAEHDDSHTKRRSFRESVRLSFSRKAASTTQALKDDAAADAPKPLRRALSKRLSRALSGRRKKKGDKSTESLAAAPAGLEL